MSDSTHRHRVPRRVPPETRSRGSVPGIFLGAVLVSVLGSCWRPEEPVTLGVFEPGSVISLDSIQSRFGASDEKLITVEGEVTEVCPTSGCWLRLSDGRNTLHVDLLSFAVTRSREGSHCRAQGRLVKENGVVKLRARGVHFGR